MRFGRRFQQFNQREPGRLAHVVPGRVGRERGFFPLPFANSGQRPSDSVGKIRGALRYDAQRFQLRNELVPVVEFECELIG